MNFERQVNRMLDDDHRANLELIDRIELAVGGPAGAGDRADAALAAIAPAIVRHIELDLARHFGFEESEIFPRLRDAGGDDLADLLTEEHRMIRAVAGELVPLARRAPGGSLGQDERASLKRLALELAERESAHISKESMALLPQVEDLFDEAADRELTLAYASS
ncbi:MAG: hemerythrin domain-containing protein [Proteobacteria bacterium]|jgi:hemerythrin-like domain-containing protein|nr:hemerythrin domain-containing protein [Pseudomonadota bacterium]